MKTSTKPHSKSRKTRKKKSGKSKGLRGPGASKFASVKKGLSAMAKPVGTVGGLLGASLVGKLIDKGIEKVKFLQLDPAKTAAGKFQVKSLVKPATLIALGISTAVLTNSKKTPTWEFINGIGLGFVAGGVFNVVKVVTKKDPFSGLGTTSEELKSLGAQNEYQRKQLADMAKVLEDNKFRVELPENLSSLPGITENKREEEKASATLVFGVPMGGAIM